MRISSISASQLPGEFSGRDLSNRGSFVVLSANGTEYAVRSHSVDRKPGFGYPAYGYGYGVPTFGFPIVTLSGAGFPRYNYATDPFGGSPNGADYNYWVSQQAAHGNISWQRASRLMGQH